MWDGSWGQSVKAPLCHYFLLILVPFLVVHRLQCTCSDVVLSRGCRGISFPPFSLTLLSAVLCEIARMWNKHIPHLSFWNCHAVFKKKKFLKYGFLNTLSLRSPHLGCGAQICPEMGCLLPPESAVSSMGQPWPLLAEVSEAPAASIGASELSILKVKGQYYFILFQKTVILETSL